jgi:hypothetical protein
MYKVYLGLDISTTAIGIAVVNAYESDEYPILLSEALKFNSSLSLEEKALKFNEYISFLISSNKYEFKSIYIEKPIISFKGGGSAATTSILHCFSGMCRYIIYQRLGIEPYLINSTSARSKLGIKILREKKNKKDKKIPIINFIEDKFKNTKTPFVYETTKFGNFQPTTDDRADAIVLCLAGPIIETLERMENKI